MNLLDNSQTIWTNALRESSFIAYIRWYNESNQCRINFSGLNYGENLSEIVDDKIRINQNELLTVLNKRSSNKTGTVTIENINQFIENHKTTDILNLCQGHDTTALLALIVGGQVSHKEFCRHLRLSFTLKDFSQTKLYADIYKWQNQNNFPILKQVA